MKKHTRK